MATRFPADAPALDLPNLGVHALWAGWFGVLLRAWDAAPVPTRAALLLAGVALQFWSYAALHNHMHVPLARSRPLRFVLHRTLGLACGFPYRGYHLHHLNHHRFDNGEGDWGRLRPGEAALHYCARWALTPWLWPWVALGKVWGAARGRAQRLELLLDFAVVDGTVVALLVWRPALGAGYLAGLVVTQGCIHYLNLAAHHGTDARERTQLANTSRSRFYNRWFFNAGLHQAHHLRPQLPWRALEALTRELEREGRLPVHLTTGLSPLHPAWAARVVRGYDARACKPPADSRTTPAPPSGAT
ncbi:fatty acid desaturase [Aggregicoccus sp. 17bor-14]|uniref:fatty acid desaturase family protein n=1 Tax=Myxococcaceae TaxID=31 RepID=UPI00129CABD9|nr:MULTISPECIES: fatty acid desaturase [Myxococcaceae]MBF5043650.1 fatty acid desaturase [Simulacricoccus sp. 17bor-14]MRI89409.1 fatty acid desaturase [Aggregicoccus sp. 17bor-14]